MNGRHDKIFTIVTAQWIMDVPPDLRANIDYVICLRDNIKVNRERIYTYFAGVFPSFAAFDEVMKACTAEHECLVIDQTTLSYDINDCVFFYKATPNLKYKLGAPEYWRFSSENPSKHGDDDDDDEEDNYVKKVRVKKRYPQQTKVHPYLK